MRKADPARPHNRDGIWYLIRKVPKAFQAFDARVIVRLSTEIRVADDPRAVRAKASVRDLDNGLQAYWRGLKDGQENEARRLLIEAQRRARDLGLPYVTNHDLASGPIEELYRRLELLVERGSLDDEAEVAAVMGGEHKPKMMVSALFTEFETLMEPSLAKHSPNQRRKWGHKYKRAVNALLDCLAGDKALVDLNRADGVAFRLYWQNRLKADQLDIGTANKQIGQIATMLKELELVHQLGIELSAFAGLSIRGQVKKSRKAFAAPFVQTAIPRRRRAGRPQRAGSRHRLDRGGQRRSTGRDLQPAAAEHLSRRAVSLHPGAVDRPSAENRAVGERPPAGRRGARSAAPWLVLGEE